MSLIFIAIERVHETRLPAAIRTPFNQELARQWRVSMSLRSDTMLDTRTCRLQSMVQAFERVYETRLPLVTGSLSDQRRAR